MKWELDDWYITKWKHDYSCRPLQVGDGSNNEKTGGGDGGGRAEDVTIFVRSDKNGQDQE